MRVAWVWRAGHRRIQIRSCRRFLSSSSRLRAPVPGEELSRTRNIGIIAHIDAGKTTTTERMLYYSGYTRRIGDVDEGSTVTDFLPAERARGITIQSAAITFNWPNVAEQKDKNPVPGSSKLEPAGLALRSSLPHNINLIDTPGHADFTFEVLRSLRILDGAVCILDGVAGVEAQTEKVWTQANTYRIPRIVYVNKLDRDGAAFARTVKEIGVRLHGWPAVCQIPWWKDGNGKLVGVGDVVGLRGLLWEEGGDGKAINKVELSELEKANSEFAAEIKKARVALVELLSEHDDEMVEHFLEYDEDHQAIPGIQITESLRRCVLQSPQKIIPVFAGASFKNVGVQPLLDAVVDLLPAPSERPDPEISMGILKGGLEQFLSGNLALVPSPAENLGKNKKAVAPKADKSNVNLQKIEACALAFKVVNDPRRGVLVYVRVYSGAIQRNAVLFNTNLNITEKAPRLLKMYANDAVEVSSIPTGQIGVIVGLKYARTGDTLICYTGVNPKLGPPAPLNTLQLRPIVVPPPVFFTSVESNSLSEEKHVADSLQLLLREDPSLNVSVDAESGQTHLAGMGELHLEIARDRLISDMKAKATTGQIEIGYREAILAASAPCTELLDKEIAGKAVRASCIASVSPLDPSVTITSLPEDDGSVTSTILPLDSNLLTINHPTLNRAGLPLVPEQPSLPQELPFQTIISAFSTGVAAALARGPEHHFPMHSVSVTIDFDPSVHLFPDTTAAALSSVARQAVQAALRSSAADGGTVLMEPVMMVTIAVNESDLGSIVHDISSARGGQVLSLDGSLDASDVMDAHAAIAHEQEELPHIDPAKIYAPPDPFAGSFGGVGAGYAAPDAQRQIVARVPLKEMVGYLKHLRSLTGGRGTFVMSVDRFERMGAQRMKAVLGSLRGDYM